MKNCRTYGFWDGGECDKVDYVDGYDKKPLVTSKELFAVSVKADDDQGLDVRLITSPDFGCIAHKERTK